MPWFGRSKSEDSDSEDEDRRPGARPKGEDTTGRWDHPYFNRGGLKDEILDYVRQNGGEVWRNELRSHFKDQGWKINTINATLYELTSGGDLDKTTLGRKLELPEESSDDEASEDNDFDVF